MDHVDNSKTEQNVASIDPVCGMTVNPDATPHKYQYEGKSYHFCCSNCREKFRADPAKYLSTMPRGSSLVSPSLVSPSLVSLGTPGSSHKVAAAAASLAPS